MHKKHNNIICREIYFDGINDLYYKETFPRLFNINRTWKRGITLILIMTEAKVEYILRTCKTKNNEPIQFSKDAIFNTPLPIEVCLIDPITGQKLSSYTKASIRYIDGTLVLSMRFNREDFIPTYIEYKLKSTILIRNTDKNRIGVTFLSKGQKANPLAKVLRKAPTMRESTSTSSSEKAISARWKGSKSTASFSYRPQNHDGSRISLDRYFG